MKRDRQMTVQELLLQDSDVIIPIGAAKLQQIILTLRSFKEKAELLTINQKKLGMHYLVRVLRT